MRFTLRNVVLAGAATSVAACAALLGIEDREPLADAGTEGGEGGGEAGVDGGTDSPIGDAPIDIPTIPDASCTPATCSAIGGSCVGGACQLGCDGGCAGTTVTCPPNTDCQLLCGVTSCDNTTCAGGHSCTFECAGKTGCKSVRCEGERCTFRCGEETCANAECDASVSCRFECSGIKACDEAPGIGGNAGETCDILCTGPSSCGGGGGGNPPAATIRCNAPDSGIVCGTATDTCKDSVVTCSGARCTIDCQGAASCEDGYCCDAGSCTKLGKTVTNRCP